MTLSIEDVLAHSYVLTQGGIGLRHFNETFRRYGLLPLPKPYIGRRVDRNSREFAVNRHFVAAHVSHLEIVACAERNDWPFVCVFEEDALPCRDVLGRLRDVLKQVPDDAFLLRLGYVPFDGRGGGGDLIECLKDSRYEKEFFGGSHAYIVFRSFFLHNAKMLQTYRETLSRVVSVRRIDHPRFLLSTEQGFWFYEWLMAPNIYRNPLQARMYTINPTENLFVQPRYVAFNSTTRKCFEFGWWQLLLGGWRQMIQRLTSIVRRIMGAT